MPLELSFNNFDISIVLCKAFWKCLWRNRGLLIFLFSLFSSMYLGSDSSSSRGYYRWGGWVSDFHDGRLGSWEEAELKKTSESPDNGCLLFIARFPLKEANCHSYLSYYYFEILCSMNISHMLNWFILQVRTFQRS